MVRHTGEHFIDVEGVAIASVLSFQTSGVFRAKFDTSQSDGLMADVDTSFSEEIFDIAVAEIESVVEPDGVRNDIGWGAPSRNLCRLYVFITRLSNVGI